MAMPSISVSVFDNLINSLLLFLIVTPILTITWVHMISVGHSMFSFLLHESNNNPTIRQKVYVSYYVILFLPIHLFRFPHQKQHKIVGLDYNLS